MTRPVTIEFYGVLQQITGCKTTEIDFIHGMTAEQLLQKLTGQWPDLETRLKRTAVAVGDELINRNHPLRAGTTVALIPPVSGG